MLDLGRTLLGAVEREPDALAVVDGGRRETWAEWHDAIRRVVSGLEALGLGHGDHLVGVLRNGYEAATLHWACQLSGIVVTPLNWRASAAEVRYVLDDADARAVAFEGVSADAVHDGIYRRMKYPFPHMTGNCGRGFYLASHLRRAAR